MKIVKTNLSYKINEFAKFIFSIIETKSHEEFSKKLINSYQKENNLTAQVQDEVLSSSEYKLIIQDDEWIKIASDYLNIDKSYVKMVFPFFRLDMPDNIKNESNKMLLPWHQEAEYYLPQGKCTNQSIVISTMLHDVNENQGSLHLSDTNEEKLVEHSSKYMDPDNKRFFRVQCEPPKKYSVLETKVGESIVFEFLRKHRSGNNFSDLVRMTLLIRASDKRLI